MGFFSDLFSSPVVQEVGDAAGIATTGIPWGTIGQIGASTIGGLFSAEGAKDTNAANLQIAQANNAFNADQAQQNRVFQTNMTGNAQQYAAEMSNSSYQRAVQDMKLAGLNPMLAYSQGGASSPTISSPSGAMASSSGNPQMQNVNAAGIQGALASAQASSENERSTLIHNQAAVEKEKASQEKWTTANFETLLQNRVGQGAMQVDLTQAQIRKAVAEIANLAKEGKLIDARQAQTAISTDLARLEIPQADAIAKYWNTAWGKYSPYGRDVATGVSSAVGAYRGIQSGQRDRYFRTGE